MPVPLIIGLTYEIEYRLSSQRRRHVLVGMYLGVDTKHCRVFNTRTDWVYDPAAMIVIPAESVTSYRRMTDQEVMG
jgi:hypothetical protein